ncbi:MAG: hypothetical protein R6W81_02565 [Bacteroidales bacterium]
MIICWLVILAHSIIPHNHAENSPVLLHTHMHASVCSHDADIDSGEIQDQCEDTPVCRISGLLFHQLSQDNLPAPSDAPDLVSPALMHESPVTITDQLFYRELFPGSASLRSPPSA